MSYTFTEEDGLKARSAASKQKARDTKAARARMRREDAVAMHEYGLVDGAIAREVGVSEETVGRWLAGKRVRPKYGRGIIETRGIETHEKE
jgi:hypothetical protein